MTPLELAERERDHFISQYNRVAQTLSNFQLKALSLNYGRINEHGDFELIEPVESNVAPLPHWLADPEQPLSAQK